MFNQITHTYHMIKIDFDELWKNNPNNHHKNNQTHINIIVLGLWEHQKSIMEVRSFILHGSKPILDPKLTCLQHLYDQQVEHIIIKNVKLA